MMVGQEHKNTADFFLNLVHTALNTTLITKPYSAALVSKQLALDEGFYNVLEKNGQSAANCYYVLERTLKLLGQYIRIYDVRM